MGGDRDNKGVERGSGNGAGKKMIIVNVEDMAMRNRDAEEQQNKKARRRAGSDADDVPAKTSEDIENEEEEVWIYGGVYFSRTV